MTAAERIAVVGPPGAGKSHLAARLATATGLPLIDLDDLYWGTGWTRPSPEEWLRRHHSAVCAPRWIIAGNFQSTVEDRIDHSTHLVVVDPGPVRCFTRLLRRTASIYAGNTAALPEALRAHGRWSAGRGFAHIALLGLRYRRDLLPTTTAAAAAREVPVVRVGSRVRVNDVVQALSTAGSR